MSDVLTVEVDGPVRVVVLNRPEALNAIDRELHRELAQVWRRLAADREARAVVLTGAGRAFSAGGDLDWIASFAQDHVARDDSLRETGEIVDEMLRFPLPVVAAVNGPAVGLGCSVALLCDVVLISETASMADPHVPVGLVPGDGGAAFWPLLTPLMRSREYLLTGERIPAATAVELGLATRTVPPGELMAEARRVAARMAAAPAHAVQGAKQVLNMHLMGALPVLHAGIAAERATMQTADHQDRVQELRRRATEPRPS
ncbi:enoyl-CoA hydratase/isomerase family protein [Trujillonella endophytica]|uniref:Enoyl-CoA hydratase n=1 Tax=Trujillonella endophytica TaxID=673521 RepID=A0A1H8V611_9ACTN|nr:enoyl-CoA hydratase/isomerase family protein [Trujillella endophytica]SEP10865.1 enoyl-CoA hydratase [Trujillella endophytica]